MMDDDTLLERLRSGDSHAYLEITERFAPQIYRLAYGITQDSMEAQDTTQDVLLTIFRRIEDFQGRSSIQTWIYRIAVNASLDRVRARQRRHETLSIEEYLPSFTADGMHAEEIVDWSELPLDHLLNHEAQQKLQESIDSLPEDLKVVLVMKDVEGFHLKEIVEILELSLPAVKSRLHRARLALRGMLSSYFQDKEWNVAHEQRA
jgi:RNA polymerase sigma-70 factor (ECF subfamily)